MHGLGKAAYDRQAESGPAEAARGRAVGLHEGLKQPFALFGGKPDAGVGDPDDEPELALRRFVPAATGQALQREPDRACLGELDGVAQKIEQDLSQPQGIAQYALGHVGRDVGCELHALGGGLRGQRLDRALDQLHRRQVEGLEIEATGLDLREIEDVVDDAQQRRRRIVHCHQRLVLFDGERRTFEDVDHAEHAVHWRADFVADGGEEGRLGLVGVLGLALSGQRRVACPARLVVGNLQALREIFLLHRERDVVVLPAMDIANIGHQVADIGAAGDADQLEKRVGRRQQHEQQRRGGGDRESVEGRRMGRADRHRRGDGGEQHQAEQHALQFVILGSENEARHTQAGAGQEGEPGEPPAPADHLSVGRTRAGEIAPQDIEADGDRDMGREGAGEFEQVGLAPVDRRDHRPEHERKIARLRRALEQAPDEFGANERLLAGRARVSRLCGRGISRGDRHGPSSAPACAVLVGVKKETTCGWLVVVRPNYCIKNVKIIL